MADPATLALAGVFAAASGTSSVLSGRAQNKAIEESQEQTARAVGVQQKQIVEQQELDRRVRFNETQRIVGALRVAQADAGVGDGGSFARLEVQAGIDQALNNAVEERNVQNAIANVRSGGEARIGELTSGIRNPILDLFTGALSGAQTGLLIGSALGTSAGPTPISEAPGPNAGGFGTEGGLAPPISSSFA